MKAVELLKKEIWKLEGSLRRAKTKKNITDKEVCDLKRKLKIKKFILSIVEEHVGQKVWVEKMNSSES